jgi:hypothetical protein
MLKPCPFRQQALIAACCQGTGLRVLIISKGNGGVFYLTPFAAAQAFS